MALRFQASALKGEIRCWCNLTYLTYWSCLTAPKTANYMLPNHGRRTHKSQVTLRANLAGISLFSSLGSFHTITVAQIPRIVCVCVPSGTFFTVSIPCIHRFLNSLKSAQALSRASATHTPYIQFFSYQFHNAFHPQNCCRHRCAGHCRDRSV